MEKADKGDWARPMVTLAKPDGSVQVTMDLSRLNRFIMTGRFPLPTLLEIFQKVCGSAFLSTLDLRKAYHRISLHPESRLLMLTMTLPVYYDATGSQGFGRHFPVGHP